MKIVITPRANEGWEGVGVLPAVLAGNEDALEVARKLIEKASAVATK